LVAAGHAMLVLGSWVPLSLQASRSACWALLGSAAAAACKKKNVGVGQVQTLALGRSVAHSRRAVIGHRGSLLPRRFGTSESRDTRVDLMAGVGRSCGPLASHRWAPGSISRQVIQAGLGDTALFSVTSSCHNCQLSTQRVMGSRGKALSRQARPRGHAHPLPKGRKKKS